MLRIYFRRPVWLLVICITFLLPTPRLREPSSHVCGYPTNSPLIEQRHLDLIFCGINESDIDSGIILEAVNDTFPSEYPFGDSFSQLILDPRITLIDPVSRNYFVQEVASSTYTLLETTALGINHTVFVELVTKHLLPRQSPDTYYWFIINLAFAGSPFENSLLYLDYSYPDHDTQHESLERPYAPYGVTFTARGDPVFGLLVSSPPMIPTTYFSQIQELVNGSKSKAAWNHDLSTLLTQSIWSRVNPSPVFRYEAHQQVNIHLSLITLDANMTIPDLLPFLDHQLIGERISELLVNCEVQTVVSVVNTDEALREVTRQKEESYGIWAAQVMEYLKQNSEEYWDTAYRLPSGQYYHPLDLYAAVVYGPPSDLPWSDTNVGLTFFASDQSELGTLALVTLNSDTLFVKHEGLTLTTLHELGHLFGLNHPHDFWNPVTHRVEYTEILGYSGSPMTYLSTSYDWDFFEKQTVSRIQIHSLERYMEEYAYLDEEIATVLHQFEMGTESVEQLLIDLQAIYTDYYDRVRFHLTFINVIISLGIGSFLVFTIGTIYFKKWRK